VSRAGGRRWLEDIASSSQGLRHALPRLHLEPADVHPDPPRPDEDHTFASCQACEWKGWFKEGADVPLGKVLSLASERHF
jgi:hypothetical protein